MAGNNKKYIFITGGVVSGLGKGITGASLGRLLKARGVKVTMQKLDPYINIDPGTMSPFQHGEVFVTDDGTETDLDLGHYERFIDERLNVNSNVTTGKVYWSVLTKERRGEYLGETIQVIPHITDEIKSRIYNAADLSESDVNIVEIGGTVGDMESQPFLESIRQVARDKGSENCLFIHVTFLPFVPGSEEYKTKPTQHSVKELLSIGIQPDILVCRCDQPMEAEMRRKIALFCNVTADCVIDNTNVKTLYEAPLMLERSHLADIVCDKLHIPNRTPDLAEWKAMVRGIYACKDEVKIGLVGKYVKLHDAYLSVAESLFHGGIANGARVRIEWIDAEELEKGDYEDACALLQGLRGILIPGGFGQRGTEGKIAAIRYARENNVPMLGICLGMQLAVIEFARNVLGYTDANSGEFDPASAHKVIDLMEYQKNITDMGGTMRLGKYPCFIAENSKMYEAYGQATISERHRHRYEFNNDYREIVQQHGMRLTGLSPDSLLVEAVELTDHPWFVAVQYHPEFQSRPTRPHPLFRGFIEAAKKSGPAEATG
ncbi:MAG: CTP synthase [Oscillospiraceae bacterium]|jgi:CTP synthase|nr:CTP synthase [Oscillospiraceae bacterium]